MKIGDKVVLIHYGFSSFKLMSRTIIDIKDGKYLLEHIFRNGKSSSTTWENENNIYKNVEECKAIMKKNLEDEIKKRSDAIKYLGTITDELDENNIFVVKEE